VQLRFDVRHSPSLPLDVAARLERLAGTRLTRDGVLVIIAQRHRTQARNRDDARDRLVDLIRRAAIAPIKRRPTKPTKASRERRIEGKKRRGGIKHLRQAKPSFD
jgi:ribosome-associated protein